MKARVHRHRRHRDLRNPLLERWSRGRDLRPGRGLRPLGRGRGEDRLQRVRERVHRTTVNRVERMPFGPEFKDPLWRWGAWRSGVDGLRRRCWRSRRSAASGRLGFWGSSCWCFGVLLSLRTGRAWRAGRAPGAALRPAGPADRRREGTAGQHLRAARAGPSGGPRGCAPGVRPLLVGALLGVRPRPGRARRRRADAALAHFRRVQRRREPPRSAAASRWTGSTTPSGSRRPNTRRSRRPGRGPESPEGADRSFAAACAGHPSVG